VQGAARSPRGWGLLLTAALLLALATFVASESWLRGSAEAGAVDLGSQTTLRLSELPPGYGVGEDECERADRAGELEDAPATVRRFLAQNRLEGCIFKYSRLFRASGQRPAPKEIATVSVAAPNPTVAANAAPLVPELIALMAGKDGYTEVAPLEKIGAETRLFHIANPAGPLNEQPPASALFWRDGRILAGLMVSLPNHAVADQLIFNLAHLQQAHVDSPTPYTEAEADDTLVELDDPRIGVPVYWLGAKFSPGHGLPPARASVATGRGLSDLLSHPLQGTPAYAIFYTHRLLVGAWDRPDWSRLLETTRSAPAWAWDCTRSRRVRLPRGHAIIYGAYEKDYERCPSRPPEWFFANAFIGNTVVAVNTPICGARRCSPYFSDAYGSFRAMATVVRGLQVRPPRIR
jgi:hypothetical protein